MWYCYILQSLKDKRTYTGYTGDIKRRLASHNQGEVSATKNRRPFVILFTEKFIEETDAKKRELYWKGGAGRRKLKEYFKMDSPASKRRGSPIL